MSAGRRLLRVPSLVLVALIRGWQLVVSPWYGPTCRFYPSCSSFAIEALRRHGAVKGSGLAAWRLLRCNPWNPGGVDPVPLRGASAACTHEVERPVIDLLDRSTVVVPGRRGA
jgi:uncharacterized protein